MRLWMFVVIGAICGYSIYDPCPPGMTEPFRTSMHLSFLKLFGIPSRLVQYLGLDYIAFNRYMWENLFGYSLSYSTAHLDEYFITEDTTIEGFEVRLYRLKNAQLQVKTPALVFYHGGGWVYSSYMVLDSTVKRMALDLGISAMAMNYRRAPEHPFPTPFEDCIKVTKYYMQNGNKFGIDATRIVLSGDSAGGNLAAAVSMKLKEDNFPYQPKVQALLFPCMQGLNLNSPSYLARTDGPWLTQGAMAFFYSMHAFGNLDHMEDFRTNQHVPRNVVKRLSKYMKVEDLPDDDYVKDYSLIKSPESVPYWDDIKDIMLNPYYSPLFADERYLVGQPLTYINACQYDVLRDDAIWYGKRLQAAGVNVEIDIIKCFHAWTLYSEDLQHANEAMNRLTDFIRKHL